MYKNDWAEAVHTFGVPSVTSHHSPCVFCYAKACNLHTRYHAWTGARWPWELKEFNYDMYCRSKEHPVRINTEAQREALQAVLEYKGGSKGRGRTIVADISVNGVDLLVGDRVVPSSEMPNVRHFDTIELPIVLLFWRASFDERGRCTDLVINRSPLFSDELGTSPTRTLAIDNLHTVNYGPMMRWTSAALWRVITLNPWRFRGTFDVKLELASRRLRADMYDWFDRAEVPTSRRLSDLTISMLGGKDTKLDRGMPHPGCAMKTKAAETQIVFELAIDLVRRYPDIPLGDDVMAAGIALKDWMDILREEP